MLRWTDVQRLLRAIQIAVKSRGRGDDPEARFQVVEELEALLEILRDPRRARAALVAQEGQGISGPLKEVLSIEGSPGNWNPTPRQRAEAVLAVAIAFGRIGETSRRESLLREVIRKTHRTGDRLVRADAYQRLGDHHAQKSDHRAALRCYRRAASIFSETGDDLRAADVVMLTGTVHFEQGRYRAARREFEEALEQAERSASDEMQGRVNNNLGILASVMGDFSEAQVHWRRALVHSEKAGAVGVCAQVYHNLGFLMTDLEEWEDAERFFEKSLAGARQVGDRELVATVDLNRSRLYAVCGDATRARAYCMRAREVANEMDDVLGQNECERILGIVCRLEGHIDDARDHFQRSIQICQGHELALAEAETLRELAVLQSAVGELESAREAWEQAAAMAKRLGARLLADVVREDLAQLSA